MAWGFEKGFVIEYDDTLKKRIDCKSCLYYDKTDKFCGKKTISFHLESYTSWQSCEWFRLDKDTCNYKIKKASLDAKKKIAIDSILMKPRSERPYNYKKMRDWL